MDRITVLAGATVLGRELADAKVAVRHALARHRHSQKMAGSAFFRSPVQTRQDVRREVARIRDIAARVEARYG